MTPKVTFSPPEKIVYVKARVSEYQATRGELHPFRQLDKKQKYGTAVAGGVPFQSRPSTAWISARI